MKLLWTLCAVAGTALPVGARAGTMLEDFIADQNPCQQLKADFMGSRIGIDKVKRVQVSHAYVALNGNDVRFELAGALACQTGPTSVVTGDASADLKATAAASLSDCKVSSVTVTLSNFGGTFRDLLPALQHPIQDNLKQEITSNLERSCEDFRAGSGTKPTAR